MNSRKTNLFFYDEVFTSQPECNRAFKAHQYFQQNLSGPEQEEFEQHLKSCDSCIRALSELYEADSATERIILDAQKADAIFEEGRAKFRRGPVDSPLIPAARTFRFPTFTNALLVVLVAILAYPAYRSFVLDQQVTNLERDLQAAKNAQPSKPAAPQIPQQEPLAATEPVVSPSLIYAVRMERDAESQVIRMSFDQTQQNMTLVFSVPTEDYQSYLFEIVREGEAIWQSPIPVTSKETSQLVSIHLSREFFQTGEYRLQITGKQMEQEIRFPEYRLIF